MTLLLYVERPAGQVCRTSSLRCAAHYTREGVAHRLESREKIGVQKCRLLLPAPVLRSSASCGPRSNHMDLPYNTGWLCAANRRNVRRSIDLDHLPSASASSSVCRLLLALAVIGAIVGLLNHAAVRSPAAPTI